MVRAMPLTSKGSKILSNMTSTYGAKKAKRVFYASINSGKLSGVEKRTKVKSHTMK